MAPSPASSFATGSRYADVNCRAVSLLDQGPAESPAHERAGSAYPLDPDRWRALSPYLDQALEMSPQERAAWLESIRKDKPALATDLQILLREHQALSDEKFLEDDAATLSSPLSGQTVGAYTLESPIGEGGMGVVWAARRSDGRFEGRAAVK